MSRTAIVLVILLQAVIPASASEQNLFTWWVDSAMVKVRPSDSPPRAQSHNIEIHAARNEFEPFQVLIRSMNDVSGVDIEVSDLKDSTGNRIPGATIPIYFVGTINVKRPSREYGETGEWP